MSAAAKAKEDVSVADTFQILDLFASLDSDRLELGWRQALWRRFDTPVFLLLLGVQSALVAFCVMSSVASAVAFDHRHC